MTERFFADMYGKDLDPEEYGNYGKIWTEGERAKMLSLFRDGYSLMAICQELGRPRSGVLSKLERAKVIKLDSAGGRYFRVPNDEPTPAPTQKTKPKKVNMTKAIETKTYVYGVDEADTTDEQLIAALRKVDNEIKQLETLSVESTKIKSMIAKLQADKLAIVAILDSRV